MNLERGELELALRKQRLQLQSDLLRERLAQQVDPLVPVLAAADRVRDGMHWLRAHPLVPLAAVLGFVVAGPRRALRMARRVAVTWSVLRRVRQWTRGRLRRHAAGDPPGR